MLTADAPNECLHEIEWTHTQGGNEGRKLRYWSAGRQMLVSSLFFLQSLLDRLRSWMSWAGSYYFFACMHDSSSVWSTLHYDESMTWLEWRDGAHASWAVCSVQGREHAVCFWRLYSTCNCNSSAGREGRRGATCRRYSNNKLACQVTHYCSCRVQYVHSTYWDLGMGCWCSTGGPGACLPSSLYRLHQDVHLKVNRKKGTHAALADTTTAPPTMFFLFSRS
jgi:hypothetical protein